MEQGWPGLALYVPAVPADWSPRPRTVQDALDQLAGRAGGGVTSVTGTAPIASSGGATPDISITPATDLAAGSMSAADKAKLDGLGPPTSGMIVVGIGGPGTYTSTTTFPAGAFVYDVYAEILTAYGGPGLEVGQPGSPVKFWDGVSGITYTSVGTYGVPFGVGASPITPASNDVLQVVVTAAGGGGYVFALWAIPEA